MTLIFSSAFEVWTQSFRVLLLIIINNTHRTAQWTSPTSHTLSSHESTEPWLSPHDKKSISSILWKKVYDLRLILDNINGSNRTQKIYFFLTKPVFKNDFFAAVYNNKKKISFETQKQNDQIFVLGSIHILFPQVIRVVAQFVDRNMPGNII